MKTCNRCEETKNFNDFYSADNSCKDCRKALVRKYRDENLAKCQEYDRSRSNNPERVKARADYALSKRGKERQAAGTKAWQKRNSIKRQAHITTGNAIRDGKIQKGICEVCKTNKSIEAHHDDYTKPLEVRWLCQKHHAEHHKQERDKAREKHNHVRSL